MTGACAAGCWTCFAGARGSRPDARQRRRNGIVPRPGMREGNPRNPRHRHSEAALETASIDERLSTDEHRAAVSYEVAAKNRVERIAFEARNFPTPGGHHALAVDPDAPAVNQSDAFSSSAKPLELALDLRGRPQVIGIDERDEFRSRSHPAGIAGGGQSGIRLGTTWTRSSTAACRCAIYGCHRPTRRQRR